MLSTLRWIVYELTGVRAVYEHIRPPKEGVKKDDEWRSAPTFVLWIAGIYTALFGLASARYENAVDSVEIRAGAVVALLANDSVRADAARHVAEIQQRTVPRQPKFTDPLFVRSFWEDEIHQEAVDMMKTAVESCKKELEGANLEEADLSGAALWEANLEGAILFEVNLEGADLGRAILEDANVGYARLKGAGLLDANLESAYLYGANFEGANLKGADLKGVYLGYADLKGAHLDGANLEGANLRDANFEGANLGNANLRNANLRNAILRDVILRGTKFNGANFMGSDFTQSILLAIELDNNTCWQDIQSMQGAIIVGWEDMPEDFVVFAFTKGAELLDRDYFEWFLFKDFRL